MNNLKEKLIKICGELVINGKGIKSVSKPVFNEKSIYIEFVAGSGVDWIDIPYSTLSKLHDYTLDAYMLSLFKEHKLL